MALMHKESFNIIYGIPINKNININNFFEIDDFIVYVISTLNKKGYITTHCCSGHNEYKTDTYITFKEETLPSRLPKDFILEDEKYYEENYYPHKRPNGNLCIRKPYNYEGDKLEGIIETMGDLKDWAESLPNRKESN